MPLMIYAELDRDFDVALAVGALLVLISLVILLVSKLPRTWTGSRSTSPTRASLVPPRADARGRRRRRRAGRAHRAPARRPSCVRPRASFGRTGTPCRLGGEVWLDTDRGIDLRPEERSVGYVFQDYALFPHLHSPRMSASPDAGASGALLERFQISHLARERPSELSGGERQRVALARAPPARRRCCCSTSRRQRSTRAVVRLELRDLLHEIGIPALLVTHDFEDAAALRPGSGCSSTADSSSSGRPPSRRAPADPFVASFWREPDDGQRAPVEEA